MPAARGLMAIAADEGHLLPAQATLSKLNANGFLTDRAGNYSDLNSCSEKPIA